MLIRSDMVTLLPHKFKDCRSMESTPWVLIALGQQNYPWVGTLIKIYHKAVFYLPYQRIIQSRVSDDLGKINVWIQASSKLSQIVSKMKLILPIFRQDKVGAAGFNLNI